MQCLGTLRSLMGMPQIVISACFTSHAVDFDLRLQKGLQWIGIDALLQGFQVIWDICLTFLLKAISECPWDHESRTDEEEKTGDAFQSGSNICERLCRCGVQVPRADDQYASDLGFSSFSWLLGSLEQETKA